ncbi:MAG: terpene cyclase/mutase family protein, partial [Planctomycetales bacterium]
LDELDPDSAGRAGKYLKSQLHGKAAIIDFLSLLYAAMLLQTSAGLDLFEDVDASWREAVAETLEGFRRDDGGYARTHEGGSGSTYNSFLVVLCQQLIAWPVNQPERLIEFVKSRQREDGGFVEIPAMRRSGSNPTCAAVALLGILGALDDDVTDGAVDYLADRQSHEGGLTANTLIPVADVLSTFTGMLTLADLNALDEINADAARKFLEGMQRPEGGFRGAILDDGSDAEYTFYGLGGMALLAQRD